LRIIGQTIKYFDEDINAPKKMDLSQEGDGAITAQNFKDYVMKHKLLDISKKYVVAYDKALGNQEKIGAIIPVTPKQGYTEKKAKSEGIDWAYVAKKLVNEDPEDAGELNI
jgi:hypothetical protein